MVKRRESTGSFRAQDEKGNEYVIYIYTDILDASTRGNPQAEIEGMKELRTEAGQAVNRLEKGKYQVVETGQVLVSQEPDAI